jgi:hypothetical protein
LKGKYAKVIYEPLKRGEIRLLELHPRAASEFQPRAMANGSSSIDCRLVHALLEKTTVFEALLYVWGTDTSSISLATA